MRPNIPSLFSSEAFSATTQETMQSKGSAQRTKVRSSSGGMLVALGKLGGNNLASVLAIEEL